MRIAVYFTISEVDPAALAESTVVVVDVVRATTTIVEALANGARAIYPTASTEEAVKLAGSLGRDDTLLCGERRAAKVEGFDLGNSPGEFTRATVEGKRLVMSTTNGTRAFIAGEEGERLLACAFTNLGAVAAAVEGAESLAVLCAGREDLFALEDALCAGYLIERIAGSRGDEPELNDAALAARTLAGTLHPDRTFLAQVGAGRTLMEIGLGDNLEICTEMDRHTIVPEMRNKTITLPTR